MLRLSCLAIDDPTRSAMSTPLDEMTLFLIIKSGVISEDVFEEVGQHGEIENLNVCDNIADHMVGSA